MLIPISRQRTDFDDDNQQSQCLGCASQGMGLFDSGIDITQWGLTEWLIVGGGLFLLFGGGAALLGGRGGSSSGRRKELRLAKAKYDLERAQL